MDPLFKACFYWRRYSFSPCWTILLVLYLNFRGILFHSVLKESCIFISYWRWYSLIPYWTTPLGSSHWRKSHNTGRVLDRGPLLQLLIWNWMLRLVQFTYCRSFGQLCIIRMPSLPQTSCYCKYIILILYGKAHFIRRIQIIFSNLLGTPRKIFFWN
jgi:hypothetical protein